MKVDSILKMLVSVPKLNSLYLQESATSKVEVSWRELGVFCKLSHLQVFGRTNISAKKIIFWLKDVFNGNRKNKWTFNLSAEK
jgi:hypothetical protein